MIQPKNQTTLGFIFAAGSFFIWGNLALYWSLLFHLPPVTVLCYRIVFSWLFVAGAISLGQRWRSVTGMLSSKRNLLLLLLCGLIINLNWGLYIYAISTGRVVESSMGYYINPLVSALTGALFFGERMRRLQKLAIALAFSGVAYIVIAHGEVPVFALSLAFTFAAYGALHKLLNVNVLDGMFSEMSVSLLPALLYLWFLNPAPGLLTEPLSMIVIIAMSGPLTAIPLMGFAAGVKRLSLTTVGIIQYLSPTMTFLLGIFYFKEPFDLKILIVFALIWAGVITYLVDAVAFHNKFKKLRAVSS